MVFKSCSIHGADTTVTDSWRGVDNGFTFVFFAVVTFSVLISSNLIK